VLVEDEELGGLPVVEDGEVLLLEVGYGLVGLGDEDVEEDGLFGGSSGGSGLLGEGREGERQEEEEGQKGEGFLHGTRLLNDESQG